MKIIVEKHLTPWGAEYTAIDDDTYSGPGSPMGWGSTSLEATQDLREQLECNARRQAKWPTSVNR